MRDLNALFPLLAGVHVVGRAGGQGGAAHEGLPAADHAAAARGHLELKNKVKGRLGIHSLLNSFT